MAVLLATAGNALAQGNIDSVTAIDAARRHLGKECSTTNPCEFTAKRRNGEWSVFVQFITLEKGERLIRLGHHTILVIDHTGKVVRRMNGE